MPVSKMSIDNFILKLRQRSVFELVKEYILWFSDFKKNKSFSSFPNIGPISINLDLTTACNFRCPYCVDFRIVTQSIRQLSVDEIKRIIDNLTSLNLKSVLVIGGGEPLLHPNFEEIIYFLKKKNLQVGIVTNGSILQKILNILHYLDPKTDWIRFSIDAGTNETFQALHNPPPYISLDRIIDNAIEIKKKRKEITLGYSFVVTWPGITVNGTEIKSNIDEIPDAVIRAIEGGFDYISFKPTLLRVEGKETLLHCETSFFNEKVLPILKNKLAIAENLAGNRIKVIKTLNMEALLQGNLGDFKRNPRYCHIQVFRQIVTPVGVYNCPAYRGDKLAKICDISTLLESSPHEYVKLVFEHLLNFDASKECRDIVCFYNRVNSWLKDLVNNTTKLEQLKPIEDFNSFI